MIQARHKSKHCTISSYMEIRNDDLVTEKNGMAVKGWREKEWEMERLQLGICSLAMLHQRGRLQTVIKCHISQRLKDRALMFFCLVLFFGFCFLFACLFLPQRGG